MTRKKTFQKAIINFSMHYALKKVKSLFPTRLVRPSREARNVITTHCRSYNIIYLTDVPTPKISELKNLTKFQKTSTKKFTKNTKIFHES